MKYGVEPKEFMYSSQKIASTKVSLSDWNFVFKCNIYQSSNTTLVCPESEDVKIMQITFFGF